MHLNGLIDRIRRELSWWTRYPNLDTGDPHSARRAHTLARVTTSLGRLMEIHTDHVEDWRFSPERHKQHATELLAAALMLAACESTDEPLLWYRVDEARETEVLHPDSIARRRWMVVDILAAAGAYAQCFQRRFAGGRTEGEDFVIAVVRLLRAARRLAVFEEVKDAAIQAALERLFVPEPA